MTADPASVLARLDEHSRELDQLSRDLAQLERDLEPITKLYEDFVDDYETGLWDAHLNDEAKLPSEAMRLKLARRALNASAADVLGRYASLMASRKRIERRIASLKTSVSADQSILSALKVEMEASR